MYNPMMPNYGMYNMTQPYQFQMAQPVQQTATPRYNGQIFLVHGEEGAKAFAMQPNCSVLLKDETANRVWAKFTDSAGFPTLKPFKLDPPDDEPVEAEVVDTPAVDYVTREDFDDLKNRFEKIEKELK